MKSKLLILAATVALLVLPANAEERKQELVTLDKGGPFVARTAQPQRFVDYLDLSTGQEKLPVTIVFNNGGGNAPGFTYLRISLAGRPLISEKDFKGKTEQSFYLTDIVQAGSSQMIIQASGMPGATLSWRLVTPAITLSAVAPKETVAGQEVKLEGTNFSAKPEENAVTVGNDRVRVTAAKPTALTCKLPEDLKEGEYKVRVDRFGIKSDSLPLTVKGLPELTGVNYLQAPPGMQITITGKGFSEKAGENKVTIGGFEAPLVSASKTSLAVTIPFELEPREPEFGVPINVEVSKVKSRNSLSINVWRWVLPTGEVTPVGPRD